MFELFDYSANLAAFTKQWQQSRQSRHDRRRLSSSKRAWRCLSVCLFVNRYSSDDVNDMYVIVYDYMWECKL